MNRNYVEEIADRIDESETPFDENRFKTLTKVGSALTTWSLSNSEYAIAFQLAQVGSHVKATLDDGGKSGKGFDAWVDGVPSEFKETKPGPNAVHDNMRKSNGKGAVRTYIRMPDDYSAKTAMASLDDYLRTRSSDFQEYHIWAAGDPTGWSISGTIGGGYKCKGHGC
ncbi:hypothetical protein ACGF0D_15420 [Kitasatospora sp. NPDC048298]|uniref:hypothetical protein n=1 Tax=Kitasatospora sp. NPDC048298 TaxID=3364049 RepID=UPI003717BAB9